MLPNPREQLIIFTRYPAAGRTKTRLIPALGPEGAAALQRRMTERIVSQVRRLAATRPLKVEIRYAGGDDSLMRSWLGSDLKYVQQVDGGLDRRMEVALSEALADGAESAVILGTDVPDISTAILDQAFDSLSGADVVFGPAADGGYYLVGVKQKAQARALPGLFEGIPWGSETVLALSLEKAAEGGLSVALLPQLADVDRPEDLAVWARFAGQDRRGPESARISVVIPTLEESGNIAAAVVRAQSAVNVEVIVVDGGSRDGTAQIARRLGARVLTTAPSRAGQMNAGAAAARGGILLFLHADTQLPKGYHNLVRRALSDPRVAAGAFELQIDSPGPSLRIMEKVANRRSRYLKKPYGDQALFMSKAAFTDVGGYPDLPIMEDFELVRRLDRRGRIVTLPVPVVTSARRWLKVGVWRTWILNQLTIAAYFMGVAPETLARFYRRRGVKPPRRPAG